jgi:hypothetical protein
MPVETITFHKMLTGCIQQEPKYWEFFVSTYGRLSQGLVERHFTPLKNESLEIMREVFRAAGHNGGTFLKEFSGTSEREFLIHFERKVFDLARKRCDGVKRQSDFEASFLADLFDEVPLAYQEVAWLTMKGIPPDESNQILRVPLALVQTGSAAVLKKWSEMAGRGVSIFPRLEDSVRQKIEKEQGPNCPPIKIFADVLDGRIVWRDKQHVESHVAECLYCLDRETTLKEMLFFLRVLSPLSPEVVHGVLIDLNIESKPSLAHSSILRKFMRVFK